MAIVNIRHSLLALSALTLPAAALAQYGVPSGHRHRRRSRCTMPAPRLEPWMARPARGRRRSRGQRIRRPPSATRAGARADRSAAGDRAGRGHDLHRRGTGPARGPGHGADARHLVRRLERCAGRHVRVGEPDLHRASPRPGPISPAVGRPAAGRDSRRAGAEGRLDRRAGRPAAHPPRPRAAATSYDAALAAQVKEFQAVHGLKADGDRRRRDDRGAEPRRAILRAADHHQHGARQAPSRRPKSSANMSSSMPAARGFRCGKTAARSTR